MPQQPQTRVDRLCKIVARHKITKAKIGDHFVILQSEFPQLGYRIATIPAPVNRSSNIAMSIAPQPKQLPSRIARSEPSRSFTNRIGRHCGCGGGQKADCQQERNLDPKNAEPPALPQDHSTQSKNQCEQRQPEISWRTLNKQDERTKEPKQMNRTFPSRHF